MTAEEAQAETCPRCGSTDVEVTMKIDLAFGEEVPHRACRACGHEYDHGLPPASREPDES